MGNGEVRKIARAEAINLDFATNGQYFVNGVAFHTGSTSTWTPACNEVVEAEGKALQKMKHPAMVKLLGTGTDNGRAFLRLEEIKGKTWREALSAVTPRHLREVAEILSETGRHGDIKPDNLMLDSHGDVRVIDPTVGIGDHSHMLTTRAYNPGFAATDIPALGVTLLEVLLGQHPWEFAGSDGTLLPMSEALREALQRARAVGFAPPPYERMKLGAPSKAQDLALRCIGLRYDGVTLDVGETPKSVAEFAAALK